MNVCSISVVSKWGLLPPVPGPSAILLGCFGDSGVSGLDSGSSFTGLAARWSSEPSLNSQRLRGSSESFLWDSTMGVVLLYQVSIWRQSSVKILP